MVIKIKLAIMMIIIIDFTIMQEVVQLSPEQIRNLCDARQTLNAGFAAIAEQRLANADALTGQRPEYSASEVELADYQFQHHQACQQSQALFAEENDIFITFIDDVYQVSPCPLQVDLPPARTKAMPSPCGLPQAENSGHWDCRQQAVNDGIIQKSSRQASEAQAFLAAWFTKHSRATG